MMRLRALAALFACLAVLASSAMTVAAAMPGASTVERTAAGAPCSHCDECDGMPCPIPMPACTQVGAGAVPTLAMASVELPAISSSLVHWSRPTASLSGLSPPPDPFPPRT